MRNLGKRVLTALLAALIALVCTGCGGKKTLKIAYVDEAANTFELVDTGSGKKIEYEKLIVNGKEVVDWLCTSMAGSKTVVFATEEGQIMRDGNRTTYSGQGYTVHAKLEYEMKDGTLTVFDAK